MMGETVGSGLVGEQGAVIVKTVGEGGARQWWGEVRASHFRLWDVSLAFSMAWGVVWGGIELVWIHAGGTGGGFLIFARLMAVSVGAVGWWMFSSERLRDDAVGVWGGSAWERYALVWCCAAVAYGAFMMVVLLSVMNGMTEGAV